jgi:hypothetical protein
MIQGSLLVYHALKNRLVPAEEEAGGSRFRLIWVTQKAVVTFGSKSFEVKNRTD